MPLLWCVQHRTKGTTTATSSIQPDEQKHNRIQHELPAAAATHNNNNNNNDVDDGGQAKHEVSIEHNNSQQQRVVRYTKRHHTTTNIPSVVVNTIVCNVLLL